MTILIPLARQLGLAGCLLLGLLAYYEGIPGADRIPGLASIPIIGDLTTGRVATHAAEKARLATVNLVAKTERDALAAQLKTERNRALAAAQSINELAKRLEVRNAANDALARKLEDAVASDTGGDGCVWGDADLEWLRKH